MIRILFLITIFFFSSISLAENKTIIGRLETIAIANNDIELLAKIDTGADSSSLGAEIIDSYVKNNEQWIKFEVNDRSGTSFILDRKIIRTVRIKRKKTNSIRRPVIQLGICLGNHYQSTEVNLSNRSNFKFPFLIGRKYLSGQFVVDVEKSFTQKLACDTK
ncbi:MAG: ATP-dependent zinc protease [Gammaproteobacteria bacterium]|nr:ATP-dependent zinc protease [Gammaproteobacteria bacterium]